MWQAQATRIMQLEEICCDYAGAYRDKRFLLAPLRADRDGLCSHLTIERMIELAEPHMLSLHINVREDMGYELAALISMITRKVVEDRLSERPLEEIGLDTVSRECLGDFLASNNS